MSLIEVFSGKVDYSNNGNDLAAKIFQCAAIVALDYHRAVLAHFHPHRDPYSSINTYLNFLRYHDINPFMIPHYVFSGNDFFNLGYVIKGKEFAIELYSELSKLKFMIYFISEDFIKTYSKLIIVSPKINKISVLKPKDYEYLSKLSLEDPKKYEYLLRNNALEL